MDQPARSRAVIFDIDGTLAVRDETDPNVRHFADHGRVGEDLPNPAVVELAQTIAAAGRHRIVVMSGRDEVCQWQTEMWLAAQGIEFDLLVMRRHKDNRDDAEVKEELYRRQVEPFYEVAFVVDDRRRVVKMWREALGMTVLAVAVRNRKEDFDFDDKDDAYARADALNELEQEKQ